jgi:hypothetical protein
MAWTESGFSMMMLMTATLVSIDFPPEKQKMLHLMKMQLPKWVRQMTRYTGLISIGTVSSASSKVSASDRLYPL